MTKQDYTSHYSVLLNEVIEALGQGMLENPIFADMTFGGGGHTFKLAETYPTSRVFSVDQDMEAYKNGLARIQQEKRQNQIELIKMNFNEFPTWFKKNHPDKKLSGVVMDLGVSSHHFDKFERGFSFREDAFLDMRMDQDGDKFYTAAEVLNSMEEGQLADIIYKYGEERYSRKIAREIISFRNKEDLKTTKQLENIVFHCYPPQLRHKKIHPATKTFQALRIFVNRELEVLEESIRALFDLLESGGVLAIISFHSLEDRIVKHGFKEIFQSDKKAAKILTKKPIYPGQLELDENSRSRSAKLRLLQRL